MTIGKPALKTSHSTTRLVRRMAGDYLRPYLGMLGLAVFFMVLAAGATAMFASLMEPVIDDVLTGRKEELILPVAMALFFVFALRGLATYIHTILMNKIGQSIVADIQNNLFARFMSLDLAFFNANPSGQLISRVVNDVNVMRVAVSDTLTGFGKSLLTLVFLVVVMFSKDWVLSIAAFTIFPFAALFVAWIGKRLRAVSGNIQTNLGQLSDRLSQVFQGIRLVKAYGMESYERERTARAVESVKKLMMKSVRTGQLSTPVNDLLVGAVVFAIILYGGYKVLAGETTAGELLAFIAAFTLAYEPMKKLASLNNVLQMGLGAADRVYEMMDLRPAIVDRENARPLAMQSPEIRFESVSFSYGADGRALDNVSCVIPKGKVTALVGPSGGGKTTLLNTIPRFYDVSGGRITIDGIDIRDITIASLRSQIALVSQDITIFDDSVFANIAYGKAGASEGEIIAAARAAAAHDFIVELPDGYQTRVGERGVLLSGGQRQRIAIARAIIRDAPILLLDEATSALDNESERAIQATLAELQKGRTTLVIAHRLSTIQDADQILVLQGGQIVEQGNHSALLGRAGVYARLHFKSLS
ncbi:MAG: ATP-binding cassette domain-containing protein [Alphaproteobacteria bacterium]|nr:ATP-binding cassette domain-containing protein [Alphaproteobacteria bacterium]